MPRGERLEGFDRFEADVELDPLGPQFQLTQVKADASQSRHALRDALLLLCFPEP